MNKFTILLRKDWTESVRKHRLMVLTLVFLSLGILSPVTAKYLPEIVDAIFKAFGEIPDLGLIIPKPVINDSYVQYYKNLTQMGVLIQILVTMGIVSDEKKKGTAILILTKSVSRSMFIVSKYVMSCIVLVISMIPSFVAFYFYTWMLFNEQPLNGAFMGILVFILLLVFIISFTLFASTVAKSTAISAMIALGGYFSISIVSALPRISEYFPMYLLNASFDLSVGAGSISEFIPVIVITAAASVGFMILSVASFRYQEL